MMSGPRVPNFKEGWAVAWRGARAHYFTRSYAGEAEALCGAHRAAANVLFGRGSFQCCKTCERLKGRQAGGVAPLSRESGGCVPSAAALS